MAQEEKKPTPEKIKPESKLEKKPDSKLEKKKKEGFFKRAGKFLRELKSEIKKVVWPTKKQVINNTGVVFAVMAVTAVFVSVLDIVLAFIRGLILGN